MRRHVGDGRLSGVVVASEGGRPVPGAQVSVGGGGVTRANERGEWTLTDVPMGTRQLEVRAVSFYPTVRAVDVVAGAAPVRVAVTTLKAVLDTVRVTANRVAGRDLGGFEERRRAGMGKYITSADIAKRATFALSDVFRNVSGVRVEGARGSAQAMIRMRGSWGDCVPQFYLNGHFMGGSTAPGVPGSPVSADEVDDWAAPDKITGIEIYPDGTVPPQFQQGLSGCGSIVIWTK